ncbi:MAG TPA: thioredoxin family protein [Treponemataceae bacterium]|nr:thioredoxin family protein [Treponemataceae bacterium]
MKIQILGTGCPKCKQLEANARAAVASKGVEADIEKVTDIDQIMEMGVMMTPALVIDGEVRSVGKVLTVDQIAAQLEGAN